MKKLRYIIEAMLLYILFFIFKIMPLDMASGCGGWLGRTMGPRMAASRKAIKNLRSAFPDKSDDEYAHIIRGMWDNLGRTIAEYPHLDKIGRERTDCVNAETLSTMANDNLPGILFTGHIANWEVSATGLLHQGNLPVDIVYRAPNNPWVTSLLDKARSLNHRLQTIPKSRSGTRALLHAMQQGHHIGMLIDQKYNEGISVPFFGKPAMTSPAFVQLCQKFQSPLVPGRIERLEGANFRITIYDPLKIFDENDQALPIETVISAAHTHLESWIREKPEQWLWLHRRWDSAARDPQN